jgi:hypothetical protein
LFPLNHDFFIDAKYTDEIFAVDEQIKSLLCEKYPSDMAFFTSSNGASSGRNYAKMTKLTGSLQPEDIGNEHISFRNMVNDTQHESDIDLYKKQAISISSVLLSTRFLNRVQAVRLYSSICPLGLCLLSYLLFRVVKME